MNFSYDGRTFRPVENSASGNVSGGTTFYYHQSGDIVWAEYGGGGVRFGQLIGICDTEGRLQARYQHVNDNGELLTGICRSAPEFLPDGRMRVRESWRWTSGDHSSGESVIEEVRANQARP